MVSIILKRILGILGFEFILFLVLINLPDIVELNSLLPSLVVYSMSILLVVIFFGSYLLIWLYVEYFKINMQDPKNRTRVFLLIYFITPLLIAIINWYEQPTEFTFESETWILTLTHHTGSILGVISYIWMCFNILIMIKIKGIEETIDIHKLLTFHTLMAIIALALGFGHMYLLLLSEGIFDEIQILTGLIGLYIFIGLMIVAIIFMTNRLIKLGGIKKIRVIAYKMNFTYGVNKVLHNISMVAVLIIFIHTTLSFTARSSMIMISIYFLFFDITFIGWLTHKVIRGLHNNSDPYLIRKSKWDEAPSGIYKVLDKHFVVEMIKEVPSLYTCIQCGTCTVNCVVSELTEGDYNPRQLIENTLLGFQEDIYIDLKPNVWECMQCYSCSENCPQGIELPEVFVYLRNKLAEMKDAPEAFLGEARAVYDYGKAVPSQPAVARRRIQLGLPPAPEHDLRETQDILDMSGLNMLVRKDEVEENDD